VFPVGDAATDVAREVLRVLYQPGLGARVSAASRLLKILVEKRP
jgi:hypothetical protein